MSHSKTTHAAATCEGAQAILLAAERLFAEKGYGAASIADIAEQAGVSKANIFHHFQSKEALYTAVLQVACAETTHALDELARPSSAPLTERLGDYVKTHLAAMFRHENAARLVLREILENDDWAGKVFANSVLGTKFSKLVTILREGQEQGVLRRDIDPAMIATLLMGANVFFFEANPVLRHLADVNFADDPERYNTMMMDILLRGIRTAPDTPSTANDSST